MTRTGTKTKVDPERSRVMRAVKARDTGPEMKVRRLVHGLGYRYRLHRRSLPGNPDLVFPMRRKVVFIHGCFWHGHKCKRGDRTPASNRDYWLPKLRRNVERDAGNHAQLRALGWDVLVIWECELRDRDLLAANLRSFLEGKNA